MEEIDGSLFRPEKIRQKHNVLTKLQKLTCQGYKNADQQSLKLLQEMENKWQKIKRDQEYQEKQLLDGINEKNDQVKDNQKKSEVVPWDAVYMNYYGNHNQLLSSEQQSTVSKSQTNSYRELPQYRKQKLPVIKKSIGQQTKTPSRSMINLEKDKTTRKRLLSIDKKQIFQKFKNELISQNDQNEDEKHQLKRCRILQKLKTIYDKNENFQQCQPRRQDYQQNIQSNKPIHFKAQLLLDKVLELTDEIEENQESNNQFRKTIPFKFHTFTREIKKMDKNLPFYKL